MFYQQFYSKFTELPVHFRTQDTSFNVEAKAQNIYEKVDTINEKMHDLLKILYNQKVQQKTCDPPTIPEENKILKDMKSKVSNIEKQITLIQNNHCKNTTPRRLRNNNQEPESVYYFNSTNDAVGKDMKQILVFNKKALRNMEYLTDSINYLNETTGRLHQSVDLHHTTISKCCGDNEARVAGLTDSVESAFQKLERIYLNLEKNLKALKTAKEADIPANGTIIDFEGPRTRGEDDEDEEITGSGSGDKTDYEAKNTESHNVTDVIRKQTLLHCHEIQNGQNGVYQFGFNNDPKDRRYCTFQRDGEPGWTVIQRRGDFGMPRENFNRSWNDYKMGFGDLNKQFWLGNDLIHQLTNDYGQMELKVELVDFRGNKGVVKYNRFYISPERSFYRLDIHGFDGNVSDSLLYHNGMYFSTFDSANDHSGQIPCGISHGSGWWFNNCLESNLNGLYFDKPFNNSFAGIVWEHWLGDYSLSGTTMMIRPAPSQNGLWMDDDEEEESPLSAPEDP